MADCMADVSIQDQAKLMDLATPVREWMRKNCDPESMVIITEFGVDVVGAVCGGVFDDYVDEDDCEDFECDGDCEICEFGGDEDEDPKKVDLFEFLLQKREELPKKKISAELAVAPAGIATAVDLDELIAMVKKLIRDYHSM